jgi:hypothetical protein
MSQNQKNQIGMYCEDFFWHACLKNQNAYVKTTLFTCIFFCIFFCLYVFEFFCGYMEDLVIPLT